MAAAKNSASRKTRSKEEGIHMAEKYPLRVFKLPGDFLCGKMYTAYFLPYLPPFHIRPAAGHCTQAPSSPT